MALSSAQRKRMRDAILQGAKPRVREDGERLGKFMVEEGTSIIKAEFITDRPPHRRRSTGVRLINALTYKITERGDEVTVALTVKPGISHAKVATLNNGSKAHDITPRNARTLIFPLPAGGTRTGRQIGRLRKTAGNPFVNAYSSDRSGRAKRVRHPGRSRTARGTRFMQRARDRGLARLR